MPVIHFSHDEIVEALLYGICNDVFMTQSVEDALRHGIESLGDAARGFPIPPSAALVLNVITGVPPTYELTVDTAVKKRGRKKGAVVEDDRPAPPAPVQVESNGTG